jgi:hypothetical protein
LTDLIDEFVDIAKANHLTLWRGARVRGEREGRVVVWILLGFHEISIDREMRKGWVMGRRMVRDRTGS